MQKLLPQTGYGESRNIAFLFQIVYIIYIIHLQIVLMASDFYISSSGALLFSLAKLYLRQIHIK